jgi:hypothetical protein
MARRRLRIGFAMGTAATAMGTVLTWNARTGR